MWLLLNKWQWIEFVVIWNVNLCFTHTTPSLKVMWKMLIKQQYEPSAIISRQSNHIGHGHPQHGAFQQSQREMCVECMLLHCITTVKLCRGLRLVIRTTLEVITLSYGYWEWQLSAWQTWCWTRQHNVFQLHWTRPSLILRNISTLILNVVTTAPLYYLIQWEGSSAMQMTGV